MMMDAASGGGLGARYGAVYRFLLGMTTFRSWFPVLEADEMGTMEKKK